MLKYYKIKSLEQLLKTYLFLRTWVCLPDSVTRLKKKKIGWRHHATTEGPTVYMENHALDCSSRAWSRVTVAFSTHLPCWVVRV